LYLQYIHSRAPAYRMVRSEPSLRG
jgi:hypothetical protein